MSNRVVDVNSKKTGTSWKKKLMKIVIWSLAMLSFIAGLVLLGLVAAATISGSKNLPTAEYKWAGCENLGKCQIDGFSTPPLVILSFDGFAKEYLERRIVKSLELIAECGVKADRVYPSFPSKTFPNHYTMVTGLYPESHGITDNYVFDPNLYPELLAMRKHEAKEFYQAEPIWSAYKRLTGNRVHCLFWVGCYYNITGYMPDVSPDYNQELPLKERIDTLIGWLKLPETERPALITAYLHEPDQAGHMQKNVNQELEEVNNYIDILMKALHDENLLECVNLVIVSDHGMQALNNSIEVETIVNMDGLVLSKGVVARIHLNETDRSIDEVAGEIRCKIDGVKVNTINDIPLRKHYSKSKRVGDIIIEGKPGTSFYKSETNLGDHGYDYHNENMHTVMFARGPSFLQNVTVPSFQNVQYMNLWLYLLGLEGTVDNNGTIGFFDSILKNPPIRENKWDSMEECLNFGSAEVLQCDKAEGHDLKKLSLHLENCKEHQNLPIYSKNNCFQSYCENSLIIHKNRQDVRKGVIESLTFSFSRNQSVFENSFSFVNTKYSIECPKLDTKDNFFTAGSEAISKLANAQYKFPSSFMKSELISSLLSLKDETIKFVDIWVPLSIKTDEYLKHYGKLFVLSGLAVDRNLDGIADDEESKEPTHFYRILITCTGNWLSTNPPLCKKYSDTKALAFVFPILNKKTTMDCMDSDAILLDYTSTIEDVENIASFQFQIGALSHQQNVYLRRNITTSLW
ncbi:Ectonucleotide pyrophosphatase/phosphodiesterase C27A7.3 [Caenorhabditis elegans]|uniref:Ectonucleotide pyrophosphatase/phosphodiesterase C27A7.3 n=2 Tax=Caenorhabditis elegans TaxID=6239 RepID=ENPP2_CAEEL|nr:Ectonucleotide pyrophosphatase/phosphodiesterase C27A7.3 [Caenorhabditis elegans]P90755.3 RecName: Full=Ectonucleotide pyrophosphatase/phosphodiesterase C27A7.3 [Caenorhabditis elegans]CAB02785.3 Ectonucleotide pyrophosphatase/phosphodiesterase C27A7.3 [Caenorhabditis elegans]|eukprot:NP_001041087.1 Ectonucleotide pyrophosphatase/phosphodiesterase C27A7.3 [Caenorhabditis elegans]